MGREETEKVGIDLVYSKLKSKGHAIVNTHYKFKKFEIDLVSMYKGKRYFHEVRTTKSYSIEQTFPVKKVLTICNAATSNAPRNPTVYFHYVRIDFAGKIVQYLTLLPSDLL